MYYITNLRKMFAIFLFIIIVLFWLATPSLLQQNVIRRLGKVRSPNKALMKLFISKLQKRSIDEWNNLEIIE